VTISAQKPRCEWGEGADRVSMGSIGERHERAKL
jgi:hypothetical protein